MPGWGRMIGVQPGPIYGLIEALYGVSIGEVEQIAGAFEADKRRGAATGLVPGEIGIEVKRVFRRCRTGASRWPASIAITPRDQLLDDPAQGARLTVSRGAELVLVRRAAIESNLSGQVSDAWRCVGRGTVNAGSLNRPRSWLFCPASNRRRMEKANASAAHAVIIDLEDAVAEADKDQARAMLGECIRDLRRDNFYVRINALDTPHALLDMEAVVAPALQGIMLPKSERARDVEVADWLLSQMERRLGLPEGRIEIVPLVESARGLANLHSIGASSGRVRRLAFGAADFTLDLGITWSAEEHELLAYRSALVLASRNANLAAPIDTPWLSIADGEGMVASAKRARDHGFGGKLCIHPDQVTVTNQIFAPTPAEIDEARKIVAAFEAAGSAAITLDGRMLDYPVVEAARRVLANAASGGSPSLN